MIICLCLLFAGRASAQSVSYTHLLIDSSTYFKALACDHFRRIKKNAYTIVKSNAVNALDDAEDDCH